MSNGAIAADEVIWSHWQEGRRMAALPGEVRPRTREEGYAIQSRLEARSGHARYGWKIAATSKAGQLHINVDGPIAGRLLRERVFEPGAVIPFGSNHMRVAEAEFAFRMADDLGPLARSYLMDEVMAAVATLHPAIEIPDSRFDDYRAVGAAQLIADNACAHYFVLGPATAAHWRSMNLAGHRVAGVVAGKPAVQGIGANVLGDPRAALTWLVNELSSLGITLRAGEIVTTGTCIEPPSVAPGDRFTADFGVFGSVEAIFGA